MKIVFPDNYPWFRPEVFAYDLILPRHQHPRSKNLCLLPRGTQYWDPTETFAALLKDQLNLVIEKGSVTDYDVVKLDEAEQASLILIIIITFSKRQFYLMPPICPYLM